MTESAPKVSVVVPLYNPGEYVEPCLESLLAQTLPPGQLEIVLVDDGSTDETLARVRTLEAEHPHVRVIPIPNSGWPGKPRNVGTDAARGEYVMYVDQDDRIEPDALQTMYEVAAAHGTDVVLGKVMSDFRGVNHRIYRENRPSCTVHDAPLMESLTPHKMFRTAFLREHAIRYPEGPRRLEDQLFMAQAYFAARAATIVSDRVCYRYLRRPDGGNAGSKRFDPAVYYGNLREVLDVVDAHVPPGEERDEFYRRFLRVEMLGRLGGKAAGSFPPEYLDALLHEVRLLLDERFPDSVAAGMGAAMRVRTGVVRRGTRGDVLDLADRYNAVTAPPTLLDVRSTGSAHVIEIEAPWTSGGGPLTLDRDGDRLLLPRTVVGRLATDEERRVDMQLSGVTADVVVRHRERLDEWFVGTIPGVVEEGPYGPQLVTRGAVTVDAATAAVGRPLPVGIYDVHVRSDAFLWSRTRRLGARRAAGAAPAPPVTDSAGRLVVCYETTPHENLSFHVEPSPATARALLGRTRIASATPERVAIAARMQRGVPAPYTLELTGTRGTWRTETDELGRLVVTGDQPMRRGSYRLVLRHPVAGDAILQRELVVRRGRGVTVTEPGEGVRRSGVRRLLDRLPGELRRLKEPSGRRRAVGYVRSQGRRLLVQARARLSGRRGRDEERDGG